MHEHVNHVQRGSQYLVCKCAVALAIKILKLAAVHELRQRWRARLQIRSANRFVNMDSIEEWIVITPAAMMGVMAKFLQDHLSTMPCINAAKVGSTSGLL